MDRIRLDDEDWVEVGAVPDPAALCPDFECLWALHPAEPSVLVLYGRPVPIPRFQQAFGRDYRFSNQVSCAAPVPALLEPCLDWARTVDERINGLLLNWYDGSQGHRIGPHRDSAEGLVEGSPILTLSFGQARVFRMRRWRGEGRVDVEVGHGSVVLIPWHTNLRWTHEVVHRARDTGRRISVTARAFA
jgi:alkylated DNA repair dioxygenase AlkB